MSAISGGLRYITRHQLASGGFRSYRLEDDQVRHLKSYRTTFVPSLIALALKDIPESKRLQESIAQFLFAQKSSEWSWNYWDRASASAATMPYPDDLDDTFLAFAALWHTNPKKFTPNVMAYIANLLFATEEQPGGPYRTWLVDSDADPVWHDVDLIVNSNVGYFLSLQNVELPQLTAYIEKAIRTRQLTSPYYPSLQPAAYFISRWYTGKYVAKLRDQVVTCQQEGVWKTAHETALAISTLIRLDYPIAKLEESVKYLKAAQQKDGSWPAGPICADTMRPGERVSYFTGCASLTTALCIEALQLYEQKRHIQDVELSTSSEYDKTISQVKNSIELLHQPDLRRQTQRILNEIITQDHDKQIVMLPWLIVRAFDVQIREPVLYQLARISVWGWMSYTIFDDFLDNEGNPAALPSAVTAHRQLCMALSDTLPGDAGFHAEVHATLNQLDGANAWEIAHCRGMVEEGRFTIATLPDYGDYWQLADRSLGHTIAAIGVLYGARLHSGAIEISQLKQFFRHYLIARQLNDDAHDWEEDLANGHVNAVGVMILKRWIAAGHSLQKGVDLKIDKKQLRLIMWETVIDDVCRLIDKHAQLAKDALRLPGLQVDAALLEGIVVPLEEASKKALETRDESLEFIASL